LLFLELVIVILRVSEFTSLCKEDVFYDLVPGVTCCTAVQVLLKQTIGDIIVGLRKASEHV